MQTRRQARWSEVSESCKRTEAIALSVSMLPTIDISKDVIEDEAVAANLYVEATATLGKHRETLNALEREVTAMVEAHKAARAAIDTTTNTADAT